jgi:3-carboxy-cis,cis-muconate cycloisomerase
MAVQLGGAAGTLAALGDAGPEVVDALSGELGLAAPVVAWHTNRSRVEEIAGALAQSSGAAAKVALDVALLMQTEVGEVREPGHGGSSAMPHKRNPAISATVLACARRAAGLAGLLLGGMAQEHERAVGTWQSEWQTLTDLGRAAGGAAAGVGMMLFGLEVLPDAMARNLELTDGLVLTERVTIELARPVGYADARRAVETAARRAVETGVSLRAALSVDESVKEALAALPAELWDVAGWLGPAETVVDRALALYRP